MLNCVKFVILGFVNMDVISDNYVHQEAAAFSSSFFFFLSDEDLIIENYVTAVNILSSLYHDGGE